jgi:hypothetical protein
MDPALQDTLNHIIGSKAVWVLSQVILGFGLMLGVKKLFKEVEEGLSDETKLKIWVWLADRKENPLFKQWPDTLEQVFNVSLVKGN